MTPETESDDEARLLTLARHHLEIRRPEQALSALARAQRLAAVSPEAWRLRAAALIYLERYDEAADAASRALALDASNAWAFILLAQSELGRGDLAASERAFLAALELDPEDATHLALYAKACLIAGQIQKGKQLLDVAIEIEPENRTALRGLWLVAYIQGHNAEARRISDEYLAGDPDDAAAHVIAGNTGLVRNDFESARRHFAAGVRAHPERGDLAKVARETRVYGSWFLWPIRPFLRWGSATLWFVGVGGMVLLSSVGWGRAALAWALLYLFLCVYSWVVPPLVRRAQRRRFR
jgi:tetratricopeptide (TPR) repeat protein